MKSRPKRKNPNRNDKRTFADDHAISHTRCPEHYPAPARRAIRHRRTAIDIHVYGGAGVRRHGRYAAGQYGDGHCLFLFLVLLYRFICLRRIRYRVGEEQLVCERGLFCRRVDHMELYRIVDFQEHQSLLQQLCGLKTVVILSTDRNSPKLDLIGIRRGNDIVAIIRERVEINKRKKGIYEITNH